MKKAISKGFLWVLLLPVFGIVELLLVGLRFIASLKPKTWMFVGGAYAVWDMGAFATLQLKPQTIRPVGHMTVGWFLLGLVALLTYFGIRSSMRRRLWRRLR